MISIAERVAQSLRKGQEPKLSLHDKAQLVATAIEEPQDRVSPTIPVPGRLLGTRRPAHVRFFSDGPMTIELAGIYDPINLETDINFDKGLGDVCRRSSHEHRVIQPEYTHGNIPHRVDLVTVSRPDLPRMLTENGIAHSVAKRMAEKIKQVGPFSILHRDGLTYVVGRSKPGSDLIPYDVFVAKGSHK